MLTEIIHCCLKRSDANFEDRSGQGRKLGRKQEKEQVVSNTSMLKTVQIEFLRCSDVDLSLLVS